MYLTVIEGHPVGKRIHVKGGRFLIGRDESCQLRPHSEHVSRLQAELRFDGRAARILDLGSQNGTRVNGRTHDGPVRLRHGDQVQIGPLVFAVSLPGGVSAARGRALTEDQVASWLVSGEDDNPPTSLGEVYGGETQVGEGRAEEPSRGRSRDEAREAAEADDFELLKAMTSGADNC